MSQATAEDYLQLATDSSATSCRLSMSALTGGTTQAAARHLPAGDVLAIITSSEGTHKIDGLLGDRLHKEPQGGINGDLQQRTSHENENDPIA